MKKIVLLDANHLMHRAYWAIQRNLSTSKGEQTNAVFGVASMLLTILTREEPDLVIACFDEGSETFRHKEYKEYKAGRQETPDDFYDQIPRVYQCMESFAIPTFSDPKYEADDLIGTLAVRARDEGFDVVIVTGDKDLFQMADDRIRIAVPHKGYSEPEYLDAKGVELKLEVRPDQIPDYKGLVGDSSDNLKGVKGIGPKTAAKLLQKYDTLEKLYDHLDEVLGTAKTKLEADRESAFFCRDLARLVTDVPAEVNLRELSEKQANTEDLDNFFTEVEFHTLRRRLKKLLTESAFAQTYFSGSTSFEIPEEVHSGPDRVSEEQLPLLD